MAGDDGKTVLVVGGGGREHALCRALAASPRCGRLVCAPGNAGIAQVATCMPVAAEDIPGLVTLAREQAVDLVVVGPEAPLVAGLVDALTAAGIAAFGPTAAAARLEGSKGFMKDVCARHGVPTAAYARFTDPAAARDYIRAANRPLVVKTDGLAAGKGVILCAHADEALAAVDQMMEAAAFGAAGRQIVVEERLQGEEASLFALVAGDQAVYLGSAQDHKAVGEGDTGPNTGGMGAYAPAPVLTEALVEKTMDTIVRPVVRGLAAEGTPYTGILFAGLMIEDETPRLLEFNVRFGDPECQVVLPRLQNDLLTLLADACQGVLPAAPLRWAAETALTVVMAARGYPGAYEKGAVIRGVAEAEATGATLTHAGTGRREDGALVAQGGRVLNVTALGETVRVAQGRAYAAVDRLDWPEGFCRRDIGWRAVAREG